MSDPDDRSSIGVSVRREIDGDGFGILSGEELRLQIHTEPGRLEDAVEAVEDVGGDVQTSYETLIVADVFSTQVEGLAESDAIRLVNEYVPPEPHANPEPIIRPRDLPDGVEMPDLDEENGGGNGDGDLPVTEGIEIMGADELHDQGITGKGTTVAILDSGFNVENEQYADQVIATLGDPEHPDFEDAYESPGGHGDAVTDIVAAVVPDADLILADTFDVIDIFTALDILEAEFPEVDVVNYSVGHLPDFRIDGLDPISLRIAAFTEETDSIFVNSAGNSAAVEDAWQFIPGIGPFPLPQNNGDVYDSQGPAEFDGEELLEFDAHFDENLEVATRLPLMTFEDVALFAAAFVDLGWTVVHWDADPDVDDQVYEARLYRTPDADDPLEDPVTGDPVVSQTANPWETIDVWPHFFMDEISVTMDVDEGAWKVTDQDGQVDIAPVNEPNPTLTTTDGQRYTIENEAWDDHPLEFRDTDGNPLLSQDPDTPGAFEDDPVVDWVHDDEVIAFTVTHALADALATYVSAEDGGIGGDTADAATPPIYVEVERIDADEDHHFDVWGQFGGVNVPTPWATDERTVGIPALSQDPNLLSVAAVQAVDLGLEDGETGLAFNRFKGDLKSYSSQGPTQDGRLGIDLAGPSHVSTNAVGPVEQVFGFNGTSAAAPHVAGAVALLFDAISPVDVRAQTGTLGPGDDERVTATVEEGDITTPGEYVLRAITDDDQVSGQLTVDD